MALLQQAPQEANLFGWYVGFIIAFAIIVVVVVLVAAILQLASRINRQAVDGTEALRQAQETTLPLWDLGKANNSLKGILRAAQGARQTLGG
ncbi:MAG: hypothetical protein M3276_09445 [Actinomycetota bacterium]|nr:hypothetical protein [Actinomycetota bacterium]